MTKIYNAYETKRKCEKLYSDIICFNIYNLPTKDVQWTLYNEKINKIVNEIEGEYQGLNLYDEIFTIGDKINIHYLSIRIAIIKSITVKLNHCTWMPEFIVESEDIHDSSVYKTSYDTCIHLVYNK